MNFANAPRQWDRADERSFREVNVELIRHALAFCEWLLPGGEQQGAEYICAGVFGGEGKSCGINLTTGRWNDFAEEDDSGGDLISLYAAHHEVTQHEALAACIEWLDKEAPDTPERAAPERDDADAEEAKRQRKQRDVDNTWSCGRAAEEGTATARYLRARGYTGPIPDTVRHVDDLTYWQGAWAMDFPGLIAAVQTADGETTGLQRIYLGEDGSKAKIVVGGKSRDVKKALGRLQGGAVRLSAPGSVALVGEGIETTLAALEAWPDLCAFATISAGGMTGWQPPVYVIEVLILADNDRSKAGQNAAKALATRLTARGIRARIAFPPPPDLDAKSRDFNDVLLRDGLGAVRDLIEGAQEYEAAPDEIEDVLRPLPKGARRGVEPYYSATPLEPEDVSARLREEITSFFESGSHYSLVMGEIEQAKQYAVEDFHRQNPTWDPDVSCGILLADKKHPMTVAYLKQVRKIKRAAAKMVLKQHGLKKLPQMPRLQIAAGAGSGKTQAVIEALAKLPQRNAPTVHYYVPSHSLAGELEKRFQVAGVPARVIRGRTAKGSDGQPMCRKPKAAAKAGKLGLNVLRKLCESKDGKVKCEFRDGCPYFQQVEGIEPREVLIMSHEYLHLPPPKGMPTADLVVVDESPVGTFLAHVELDPEALVKIVDSLDTPEASEKFLKVCAQVKDALLSGEPLKATLLKRGLDRETLLETAQSIRTREATEALGINPRMPEREALERMEKLRGSVRPVIRRLLFGLASELKFEREEVHRVHVREVVAKFTDGNGRERSVKVPMIYVHYLKRPEVGSRCPVLAIDADANHEIGKRLWGRKLEHVDLPARRNAVVTQVTDQRFSKFALVESEWTSPKDRKTAERRLRKVRRFIRARVTIHGPGKVLVVTNKPVRCAITGESAKGKLPAGCDWKGATVANFGNIRGIDLWKDYDCIIVIGREQPRPEDIEGMARSLYCEDPEPLQFLDGAHYPEALRGYRMSDGRAVGVPVPVHPDNRVEGLLELTREREITQAIDRLRLVHRSSPAQVFFLGNLPVDCDVDWLIDFDTLLLKSGVDAALSERGALPLSVPWLVEHEPTLVTHSHEGGKPSRRGVEDGLKRHGLTLGPNHVSPNKVFIWKNVVWSPTVYTTTNGGKQRLALLPQWDAGSVADLERELGEPVKKWWMTFQFFPDQSEQEHECADDNEPEWERQVAARDPLSIEGAAQTAGSPPWAIRGAVRGSAPKAGNPAQ